VKLDDLLRMVEATEGKCVCPEECRSCRVQDLVRLAHAVGGRSGIARATTRNARYLEWDEYEWDQHDLHALQEYTYNLGGFFSASEAHEFNQQQLGEAGDWARSKGERRVSWPHFMRGWIRRARDTRPSSPPPRQADLFRQEERLSTHIQLVEERRNR
jgi:hypothetical protein